MIKKIISLIKLNLVAGKATPAPPVGPVLGQYGINIAAFCKDYNTLTLKQQGIIIPVEISIYEDKSYSFNLKTPPTSILLKNILNIKKGSSNLTPSTISFLTKTQLIEITKIKLPDLNTKKLSKAIKIITGTAQNMGIKIMDD